MVLVGDRPTHTWVKRSLPGAKFEFIGQFYKMPKPWYRPDWTDHRVNNRAPEYRLTAEQYDQIEEMSLFHCSLEEMAHAFNIDRHTMQHLCRRDPEINKRIAIGKSRGARALRSVQFKVALSGNCTMLMYLGKVILGQCPDSEVSIGADGGPTELSEVTKAHLVEMAQHIQQIALAANTTEVETEVIERDGTISQKVVSMS
jgi:hypothetical protein